MKIPRPFGQEDDDDASSAMGANAIDEFRQAPSIIFSQSILAGPQSTTRIAEQAYEKAASAQRLGYAEESSALYITGVRIHLAAWTRRNALVGSGYDPMINRLQMEMHRAFEELSRVSALPDDDVPYWQHLFAHVTAAIAPPVLASFFPKHEKAVVAEALLRLAPLLSDLVPSELSQDTLQMLIDDSSLDPRTPEALVATLAHVEILGRRPGSAWKRLLVINSAGSLRAEDRLYIYILMLASARYAENPRIYAQVARELAGYIENRRTLFKSGDGRLWEMRQIEEDLYESLQFWGLPVQAGDDLMLIAELTKSRVLLDELDGRLATTNKSPRDHQQVASARVRPPDVNGLRELEFSDLSDTELRELQKLSYYPFAPFGLSEHSISIRGLGGSVESQRNELLGVEAQHANPWGVFIGGAEIADLTSLRSALCEDELIVEYLIPRSSTRPNAEYWILVTDSKKTVPIGGYIGQTSPSLLHHYVGDTGQLFERGPLSDNVARARAAILNEGDSTVSRFANRFFNRSRAGDGTTRGFLKQLFNQLIAPVIQAGYEPERFSKWIIVPHGPLHLLPFAAVMDARGRHLIERVAVVTVPSANTWLRMTQNQSRMLKKVLAVGNPAGSGLPNAQAEVEKLPAILCQTCPDWEVTLLTKDSATVTRVSDEMVNSGIVHFATHAELDWHSPRDADAIHLVSENGEPAHLDAGHIRNMRLDQSQLVMLNACNATVCRYGPGDEPMGLLRAFISAGVGSVVGGLWPLEDQAAKLFAWDFYENLGNTDLAGAYRRAAVCAIRAQRQLADWAGIQFVGPGRSTL